MKKYIRAASSIKLSDALNVLKSVKKITVYKQPDIAVDMDKTDKYEVVSVSPIRYKDGLHVYVREI